MSKKNNKKPISYKFKASGKGGPCVTLKGLFYNDEKGEVEETPKLIEKVLGDYGFELDTDDTYIDCIGPQGDVLHEELEAIGGTVSVKLQVKPVGKGKNVGAGYICSIGGAALCNAKTAADAMDKAFKAWNKDGRPIDGVKFDTAMGRAVQQVNAKRV